MLEPCVVVTIGSRSQKVADIFGLPNNCVSLHAGLFRVSAEAVSSFDTTEPMREDLGADHEEVAKLAKPSSPTYRVIQRLLKGARRNLEDHMIQAPVPSWCHAGASTMLTATISSPLHPWSYHLI